MALKKKFYKEPPKQDAPAVLKEMRELRLDLMEPDVFFDKIESLNDELGKLKPEYRMSEEMILLRTLASLPDLYE